MNLSPPLRTPQQILGGICGSLLAAGLLPKTKLGMGPKGPGCFEPTIDESGAGLTSGQLFGWEVRGLLGLGAPLAMAAIGGRGGA
jgi:hypothetical protein